MNNKILFVDDEEHVLDGLRRSLRKVFDVHTALGPEAGLRELDKNGPFAVIVSDMRMPGMDGVEFLQRAKAISPDSVRAMLTGNADQETAVRAVNAGEVFRFLNKPCDMEVLARTLSFCLRQYQLVTAEKELLQHTLKGSIEALAEILALVKPEAFGRVKRIRTLCRDLAERLGRTDCWELDAAALLGPLGCVNVAPAILEKVAHGKPLEPSEAREYQRHPQLGAEIIHKIPRLEKVARVVELQQHFLRDMPLPPPGGKDEIPIEGSILNIVLAFEDRKSAGWSDAAALEHVRTSVGKYERELVETFSQCIGAVPGVITLQLKIDQLEDGMLIEQDVLTDKGVLMVCRGLEVKPMIRDHLRKFATNGLFTGTILVTRPVATNTRKTPSQAA